MAESSNQCFASSDDFTVVAESSNQCFASSDDFTVETLPGVYTRGSNMSQTGT